MQHNMTRLAGPSSSCRPGCSTQRAASISGSSHVTPHRVHLTGRSRESLVVRVAEEEPLVEEESALEALPGLWEREEHMWAGDNSYALNNKNNQEPDFNDPEWYKKVTVGCYNVAQGSSWQR